MNIKTGKIMRFLIHLFVIVFYSASIAQPTLTQGNMIETGDSWEQYSYDTTGVEAGQAGENITWDFTGLSVQTNSTSPFTIEIVDPSEGTKSNEFPDADIAQKVDTSYAYYKIENNVLKRLGSGFDDGMEILTNPQNQMEIPTTYQTSWSDDFEGKFHYLEHEMDKSGNVSVIADAYGTLEMPLNTYYNTLRIKVEYHSEEVLPPPMPGAPEVTITKDYVSYSWFTVGQPNPILTITKGESVTEAGPYTSTNEINNVTGVHDEDITPIQTPALLSPQDGAADVSIPFTLEWDDEGSGKIKHSDGIQQDVQYQVQLSKNENFDELHIDSATSETSLTISDAENATTYYWRVRKSEGENNSDWSGTWSFTTEEAPEPPPLPVLLTPEDNAENVPVSPEFTWENAENIEKWTIRISNNQDFSDVILQEEVTENNYEYEEKLDSKSTYYWSVNAYDGELWSDYAQPFSFTTEDESRVIYNRTNTGLEIYPNPASDILHISSNKDNINSIKITGIDGKDLKSSKYKSNRNEVKINISDLSNGMYFIVINKKETFVIPFIKH